MTIRSIPTNIRAGVAYLRRLIDRFNGSTSWPLRLQRRPRRGREISPHRASLRETRSYVRRIVSVTEMRVGPRQSIYKIVELIDRPRGAAVFGHGNLTALTSWSRTGNRPATISPRRFATDRRRAPFGHHFGQRPLCHVVNPIQPQRHQRRDRHRAEPAAPFSRNRNLGRVGLQGTWYSRAVVSSSNSCATARSRAASGACRW